MSKHSTPQGIRDFLPDDTKRLNANMILLQKLFTEHGFNQIKTPTIEFAENLEKGLGPIQKKECIEFFDPAGNRLLLRPDNTTPIARTVASRMANQPTPIKLCYTEPIFKKSNKNHSDTEIFQAGCEIFGYSSSESIAEIISMCIRSLESLDINDIGIDIGHVSFADGLPDTKKQALLQGDYIAYGEIPERGSNIESNNTAIDEIIPILTKTHPNTPFIINKGLVKGLHYYTGIIFEVYSKKYRTIIASGGQYDSLCSLFDNPLTAVGFAINLNDIGFSS
jgi:ATP phosphoribosyltransferase regulatory subunit